MLLVSNLTRLSIVARAYSVYKPLMVASSYMLYKVMRYTILKQMMVT